MIAGESVTVDVSPFFSDPDGGTLTYTAASSDAGVVSVSLTGSNLTATAVAAGTATVTVTATDPDGLTATQTAGVTVEAANRAPEAVETIPPQAMTAGDEVTVDVTPFFSDPDGDELTYTAESSDAEVAAAGIEGSSLTVTAVAAGAATVTVTAADPGGLTAMQSVEVTVEAANQAPEAVETIPAQAMTAGDEVVVDVSSFFSDPDGDELTYTAESSDAEVAAASIEGSSLTVTAVAAGAATVTVTAADPGGLTATQSAEVTVEAANQAPEAVETIPAQAMTAGDEVVVDVSSFFSDPDGDELTYTAESSDAEVAAAGIEGSSLTVTAVAAGAATVTVTAADPGGLTATQSVEVTVEAANQAPEAVETIPAQAMTAGDEVVVDVSSFFSDPDGDELTYTAESSDAEVAAAGIEGSSLTVTAVAAGAATVTVTAADPGGLTATQSVEVTVEAANQAPEAVETIPAQAMTAGDEVVVDVSSFFSDPDGDELTYTAESSDAEVAAAGIEGSSLTVTAVAAGAATVTVTAADPGGLTATQSVEVTVEAANQAPEAVETIPAQAMTAGDEVVVDVTPFFSDPDGDELTYTAESSDAEVAAASIEGSSLTVTAVAAGAATVTVTAADPGGLTATQSAEVTVEAANQAPEAVETIPAQAMTAGDEVVVDVSSFFSDPDGDELTYTAESSDAEVAAAGIEGSSLTVTAVAAGAATVTVTAADPGGLTATQSAEVTVEAANQAPEAVETIPAQAMTAGDEVVVDVSSFFSDPDGDELTYTAESSDAEVAAAGIEGSSLTVTAVAAGAATVTVTAADPGGLTATQSVEVTVEAANQAPEAVETIPAQAMTAGDEVVVDVSSFFSDPDGDELTYTAESSDAEVAAAGIEGSSLTVTAVAAGAATVTVTAADPGGLTATQSVEVTVEAANQAPEAVETIPAQAMTAGDEVVVDVSSFFSDPDGDELTYTAESSDAEVAAAGIEGSSLTVTAVAAGAATVTVTAADPGGLTATQSVEVTVEAANQAPEAVETIPAQAMTAGDEVVVDVSSFFSDPDGDELTYTAESSDAEVAAAGIEGSSLTVTAVAAGAATVTVTAADPGGLTATQSVEVTVEAANQAPEAVETIPAQAMTAGDEVVVDVSSFFSDPDGDELTYTAESSDAEVAAAGIEGSSLTVTAVAAGAATVTVTAADPGGLTATQSVEVTVEAAN